MRSVVLFRNDLRIDDNAALTAASQSKILPVFVFDTEAFAELGGASRVWLHYSLTELQRRIKLLGGTLAIASGDTYQVLREVCEQHEISRVFLNERFDPKGRAHDVQLKQALQVHNITVVECRGNMLCHPSKPTTSQGTPFKVFTPFYKWYLSEVLADVRPEEAPTNLDFFNVDSRSEVSSLGLLPSIPWHKGILQAWTPGEKQADFILERFLDSGLRYYKENRDFPATDGVSTLSPYLHFGEVSAQRVVQSIVEEEERMGAEPGAAIHNPFIRQIVWREFSKYLLFHFPNTLSQPFNASFADFPWQYNDDLFHAWKRGLTGYPLVDAGMRELWTTGWMHNRVRMVVASFLTKHLLISWEMGAAWFMDTLVDADIANNTMGWQWVAGCGADAAPYFRVFNPILQSKKFDPDGEYIRRWVPELRTFSGSEIHEPWSRQTGTRKTLIDSGSATYPSPIVDHKEARNRALAAYDQIK